MNMCVCGHSMDSHNPAYDDVWVCMVCDCGNYQERKNPDREPVPAFRLPRCDMCDRTVPRHALHITHETGCPRALEGVCRCEGLGVCADCCPDPWCRTPLGEAVHAAHLEHVAAVEADAGKRESIAHGAGA